MSKRSHTGETKKSSSSAPVSPFSTGAGGSRFETLVASYFVISLLRDDVVQGLEGGSLQEVRLQQRNLGFAVDDVVLTGRSGSSEYTTALQVRHQFRFSDNAQFREVIGKCWEQYTKPSFNKVTDRIGVVIGEISNTHDVKQNLQDLLEWARTSENGRRLLLKISLFKRKKKYYDLFRRGLRNVTGRNVSEGVVWNFLRCFVLLSFDFDTIYSTHSVDCQNKLKSHIQTRKVTEIRAFFACIIEIVSRFAQAAGDLTAETLDREIPSNFKRLLPASPPSIQQALVKQVTNQLLKQKNSGKYIPAIFVEVDDIKDQARVFAYPSLFLKRSIEKINRLNLTNLNRYLQDISVRRIKIRLGQKLLSLDNPLNINRWCEQLILALNNIKTKLHAMTQEGGYSIREEVSKAKLHLYEHLKYLVWFLSSSLHHRTKDVVSELEFARLRVLLLTSKAGAGKTNFVCDFADRFLIRHGVPALYFSGKELNGANSNQMFCNMLTAIPGVSPSSDSEDVIKQIERVCDKQRQPFVIIIDAINEHGGLPEFAHELEHLIERLISYDFIRVIMTCRLEYFSERFKNLRHASFADRMRIVEDLHFSMSKKHRGWMVRKHLEFFNVALGGMSQNVKEKLEDDPLLLRMFCEAYADSGKNIPWMSDIYKDQIFRTYLDRKLEAIAEKKQSQSSFVVGHQRGPKEVLRGLLLYMLQEKTFNDIPMTIIDQAMYPDLDLLLEEDVMIRKDILRGKGVTDPDSEVLNFTYDEFRDFLIADFLINELLNDRSAFDKTLDELIEPRSPVAEGVKKFIFYACKRTKNTLLEQLLRTKKWYDEVYVDCILELEDEFVTSEDVEMLGKLFVSGDSSRRRIFYSLVHRYNTKRYRNLNIRLLFRFFEQMETEDFDAFMDSGFGLDRSVSSYYYNRPSPPDDLISQLSELLTDRKYWDEAYSTLAELVVYLFAVQGKSYLPAVSLFREFWSVHPELAEKILIIHAKSKQGRVSWSVERLLQISVVPTASFNV